MKAKDLIDLLKTIDGDAEVLTHVDSIGFAGDFALYQQYVVKDSPGKWIDEAPYDESFQDEVGAVSVYILDGIWMKVLNRQERKKRSR